MEEPIYDSLSGPQKMRNILAASSVNLSGQTTPDKSRIVAASKKEQPFYDEWSTSRPFIVDQTDRANAMQTVASIPNLNTELPQQAYAIKTSKDGTRVVSPVLIQTRRGAGILTTAREIQDLKVVIETKYPTSPGEKEKHEYFIAYREPSSPLIARMERMDKVVWDSAAGSASRGPSRMPVYQLRQIPVEEARKLVRGSGNWKVVPADALSKKNPEPPIPAPDLFIKKPEPAVPAVSEERIYFGGRAKDYTHSH